MDDLRSTRDVLDRQLQEARAADPLIALSAIASLQGDLATHRQAAVRAAVQHHSWAEVGEALGVSKQAAHQKFAKEWASQLKGEVMAEQKAVKAALREGAPDEAAAATSRRDAIIAEIKNASRRRK